MERIHNFNAGPAGLPQEVLEKAQKEFVNFEQNGLSVMEMSHRSSMYETIHNRALKSLRDLLQVPNDFEILFLQGGASMQFAMIPMNFLPADKKAAYILTGSWSQKALKEAKKIGQAIPWVSTEEEQFSRVPSERMEEPDESTYAYAHITSNNTIYGTQWKEFPKFKIPVFLDASSDILSRPLPFDQFDLIYAGAQKNLGPSGVTVVFIKKDLMEKENTSIPNFLRYTTHASKNSLYHTPPTFSIYMLSLVLEWVTGKGGVKAIEADNKKKSDLIYTVIDKSNDFYQGHAERDSRSHMNITFRLPSEELTKQFIKEAEERGMIGLKGHRSVGGCRASIYNAVSVESCETLSQFMTNFYEKNHVLASNHSTEL